MTTSRRARQAAATRDEIIDAARRLFAERGYAGTSVAQIASAAGVSVQTIYDSVGSKAAIVQQLNDRIDEEAGVPAIAGRIRTLEDPIELLSVPVTICRNINESSGDIARMIFGPGSTEPAMSALRVEGLRRHREGCGSLAARLEALGALRDGLDASGVADVIAGLTHPSQAQVFVHEYGWTWARWHDWTLDALVKLVLSPRRGPKRTR